MKRFQPKTKQIDGLEFTVYPFNFKEAIKLKTTLFKKLAPSFGQIFGSLNENNGDISIDSINLGDALKRLFEELNENEFYNLILRIFKNVECIGEIDGTKQKVELKNEAALDAVFCGNIMGIYPLILFVLEVNYPSFFGLLGNIGNRFQTGILSFLNEKETDSKIRLEK